MEVEMKVLLSTSEVESLTQRLVKLGACLGDPVTQKDVYYKELGFRSRIQGPGSYLVRIRYMSDGASLNMKRLTEIDGVWEEIETRVGDGKVAEQVVSSIGAEHAVTVSKTRRSGRINDIEVILDNVEDLGVYLEVSIEDPSEVQEAKSKLLHLLGELEIDHSRAELRGYPTILLEKEGVQFSVK
jgi:predicted adenylyl cyclase CyaB